MVPRGTAKPDAVQDHPAARVDCPHPVRAAGTLHVSPHMARDSLPAGDVRNPVVAADDKVDAVWLNILRRDAARSQDLHRPQDQHRLQHRGILAQQAGVTLRTA